MCANNGFTSSSFTIPYPWSSAPSAFPCQICTHPPSCCEAASLPMSPWPSSGSTKPGGPPEIIVLKRDVFDVRDIVGVARVGVPSIRKTLSTQEAVTRSRRRRLVRCDRSATSEGGSNFTWPIIHRNLPVWAFSAPCQSVQYCTYCRVTDSKEEQPGRYEVGIGNRLFCVTLYCLRYNTTGDFAR